LGAGIRHAVAEPPRFPYPSWVVWRDDSNDGIAQLANSALSAVVQSIEDEQESIGEDLKVM
jgi:hypothetical protein